MHRAMSHARLRWPAALRGPGRSACGVLLALLLALLPLRAAELSQFEIVRSDDGVLLSYAVDFELPRGADEALAKAVPLYFVAEASVYRSRWYWRDKRLNTATRTWRIVYQPLTNTYRVTFGGLGQTYATRAEALGALRSGLRWRITEPGMLEDGGGHYVDFSFRLDTGQLPRPMQIGIGEQPEWTLRVDRVQKFD